MSRLCRLRTKTHGEDGQWAYEEITKLREQVQAQAEKISHMRGVMECHAIDLRERDAAIKFHAEKAREQAALIDELQQNNSEYLLLIEAEKSEWRTAHDAALIYKYKSEKTHAALKLVLDVVVPYTENGCASIPDYISNLSREALSIPTDSTQILDEVRRAEREKCAKVCDRLSRKEKDHAAGYGFGYLTYTADDCAAAIRAME